MNQTPSCSSRWTFQRRKGKAGAEGGFTCSLARLSSSTCRCKISALSSASSACCCKTLIFLFTASMLLPPAILFLEREVVWARDRACLLLSLCAQSGVCWGGLEEQTNAPPTSQLGALEDKPERDETRPFQLLERICFQTRAFINRQRTKLCFFSVGRGKLSKFADFRVLTLLNYLFFF